MNMPIIGLLLSCSFLILAQAQECNEAQKSKTTSLRLKENLLCGYDRTIRPVLNHKNTTNVTLSLIMKYFQYNHHDSSFTIDSWFTMFWKDQHLTWNKDDYEQITTINLQSSLIWMPDVSVYNRGDQSGSPALAGDVNCVVHNSGLVVCVIPNRQTILCVADLTKFPFDIQNCTLRIGSWVHSGEEINLKPSKYPLETSELNNNGEWALLQSSTSRDAGKYECCPNDTYPSLNYNFLIQRMGQGYLACMVLPMLSLLIITLCSLWIEPVKTERLLVCSFNIICHFLFNQYVSWHVLLNGRNVPQILVFGRDSLILATFTLVLTLCLKKMVEDKRDAPRWVSGTVGFFVTKTGRFFLLNHDALKGVTRLRAEGDEETIIDNSETNCTNNEDWKLLARILDTVCFIIYAIVYICMFIAFFP